MTIQYKGDVAPRCLVAALLALSLGACSALPGSKAETPVPVGPTAAERAAAAAFEREAATRSRFETCRSEGLVMLDHARAGANNGQYHRAGLILASCLDDDGVADTIDDEDRMRVLALATLSQAKAGDIAAARTLHQRIGEEFAGRDLYFADGTSFAESLGMLLGEAGEGDESVFSTVNVSGDLKNEVRRVRYWQER